MKEKAPYTFNRSVVDTSEKKAALDAQWNCDIPELETEFADELLPGEDDERIARYFRIQHKGISYAVEINDNMHIERMEVMDI